MTAGSRARCPPSQLSHANQLLRSLLRRRERREWVVQPTFYVCHGPSDSRHQDGRPRLGREDPNVAGRAPLQQQRHRPSQRNRHLGLLVDSDPQVQAAGKALLRPDTLVLLRPQDVDRNPPLRPGDGEAHVPLPGLDLLGSVQVHHTSVH